MVGEHLSGYQARDLEVVDYQMYQLAGTELYFRGPEPQELKPGEYLSCLGAAQTFGCFCAEPYPVLLTRRLGLPTLNLGYGGAGPLFYLRHPELLTHVNRGRLAIVQVMSGRSEDNSVYESAGLEYLRRRRDGRRFSADAAWNCVLESNYYWMKMPVGRNLARACSRWWGARRAARLVQENRANWVRHYKELLEAIRVPKVLLWFSKRSPEYRESFENAHTLFGEFPQFVNRAMIEEIRGASDAYVECVTERGSPQPLVSRFTGQPCSVDLARDREDFAGDTWTHNAYYPSPEMQADAAELLVPCLEQRFGVTA